MTRYRHVPAEGQHPPALPSCPLGNACESVPAEVVKSLPQSTHAAHAAYNTEVQEAPDELASLYPSQ